ncbi:MAG: hypothetical protein ACSHX6_01245 [Akkermansiaceae bacterium]
MKSLLLNQVIHQLQSDLASLKKAAAETHSASTGNDNKAEGKYDTQSIEASYLADAQTQQAKQLEQAIYKLHNLTLTDDPDTAVLGSIVILTTEDDTDHQFFLLPSGGGITLEYEDSPLTVVTPESPIGEIIITNTIADHLPQTPIGPAYISEIY